MDRARSVLKVAAMVFGAIILVPLLSTWVHGDFELPGMIDLIWKVLVLWLLADISIKLGDRNARKSHPGEQ